MHRKSHRYNKARFGRNFYELLWRHLWFAQKYLDMLIDFYTVDVHNTCLWYQTLKMALTLKSARPLIMDGHLCYILLHITG